MIQPAFEILNQRGTPMFFSDVFSNRPTAGIIGRIFISTDTKEFYRDTGSTWELIGGPGSGTVTGSGAAGQVAFWNAASTISGSNNLWWDNASSKFLVGTNNTAGAGALQVTSATGDDQLRVWGATSPSIRIDNAVTGATQRFVMGIATATNNFIQGSAAGNICISTASASPLLFGMWQTINASEVMRISTANNLLVGTSVDGGQRFQVSGTTLITGTSNTVSTAALTIRNSTLDSYVRATDDGALSIGIGNRFIFSSNQMSHTTAGGVIANFNIVAGSIAMQYSTINVGTSSYVTASAFSDSTTRSSISASSFSSFTIFNPTSGTNTFAGLNINSTINQTGTATGITRGIHIQPTLTAAADWRSIEWSNNTGWGLYSAGTSANYINGRLGLGSTTLNGYGLRNSLPLTGAVVSFGHRNNGVVQSDVTISAQYLNIAPSTQAAAFTVNNVFGILIDPLTVGAGSTVINAYAFYGDFASGTNRWNLYMNGTAANYMNGNLLIGTTTDTGQKLQVNGTSTFAGNLSVPSSSIIVGTGTPITITATTISNTVFDIRNDRMQLRVNAGPAYVYNVGDSGSSSLILMGGRDGSLTNFAPVIIGSGTTASLTRETMRIDNQNQSVLIGTTTNEASSIFTLVSTTKGFLPTRMTTAQINAIASPAEGLVVYNTTLSHLCCYQAGAWVKFSHSPM